MWLLLHGGVALLGILMEWVQATPVLRAFGYVEAVVQAVVAQAVLLGTARRMLGASLGEIESGPFRLVVKTL